MNLKLNKKVNETDFDVIPDAPSTLEVPEAPSEGNAEAKTENASNIEIKSTEVEGRKMFANKKANIALGIVAGVFVVAVIAALVFIYLV